MHNWLWWIPGGKIENTSWLPKTLIDKTTKFSKSLEKVVTDDFLTEEETNFFDELQNPDAMIENAKKIVSELCKRICDWENPSQKLFDNVCLKVIWIEGGMYPWYTQALLKKLPDWKDIAYLFQYNSNNSYNAVEEFRKKRKEYMNSKLNPMHSSPYDPIREERPTNPEQKKEKVAAHYEAIDYHTYKNEFINNIARTEKDIETDVPLLTVDDICISSWYGWLRELTKNTNLPYVEWREYDNNENYKKIWIEKDWSRYIIDGKDIKTSSEPYCFYDPKYDITHICKFGDPSQGRGWQLSASLAITIKGKVSVDDAKNLFKKLKDYNNLTFSIRTGDPEFHLYEYNRADIQQQVVDYFNNK